MPRGSSGKRQRPFCAAQLNRSDQEMESSSGGRTGEDTATSPAMLSTQAPLVPEGGPVLASPEPASQGKGDKSESNSTSLSVENHESNKSTNQLPVETEGEPKKKKKKKTKRKRNKKKRDGPMSLDPDSVSSDLSLLTPEDEAVKNQGAREFSESDGSVVPMEDAPSSLSSLVELSSSTVNGTGPDRSAKSDVSPEQSTENPSSATPCNQTRPGDKPPKSSQTPEMAKSPEADSTTSLSNSTPQDDSGHRADSSTNQSAQKADEKITKTKKEAAKKNDAKGDQNASVDDNGNRTNRQSKQPVTQGTQKPAAEKGVSSQNTSKVKDDGSSVDPPMDVANLETQQSRDASPDKTTGNKSQGNSKGNKNTENMQSKNLAGPPPKRITSANKTVATNVKVTIYFHAVLSKDFKLDPNEDRVFIRAADPLGTWDDNIVELSVSKDLGEHGFLVEGSLITTRNKTLSKYIPYKYLVYKNKKQKYEFEYIYKFDKIGNHTTNRCLDVKLKLLSVDGDWHQYDDIICVQPSKSVLKRLKDTIWPEERKSIVQGREIAGNFMLDTIFDLLRSWTDINLKGFLVQLQQFYDIYAHPMIYEDTHRSWTSLKYGENDVKKLVKNFILSNVIPQLGKEGEGKSLFIQDPLRAAVVVLWVWTRHVVELDVSELRRLCGAFCLPKMDKEDFLRYWGEFSNAVASVPNLPDMLMHVMKAARTNSIDQWILVIPLLHLVKANVKPFEPVLLSQYDSSSTGLQDLIVKGPYLNNQNRRAFLDLMKSNSHLVEVDALAARSWMELMHVDQLVECSVATKMELLDMLHVFYLKCSHDVSYSNYQDVSNVLSHVQSCLIEQKYSSFSVAYRRECMVKVVRLLERICRGVKPAQHTQSFTDIPVACMNLVALVADFAHSGQNEEVEEAKSDEEYAKDLRLLCQAMGVLREWISQTFRESLLSRGVMSMYLTVNVTKEEIEMWNNVISLNFKNEDFKREWKQTFMTDFEGKLKKESALDQIEYYCSNIEELSSSHPNVASVIEKCALESVTSLCQSKSEGKLFERFKINWKFGKLISAIVQKSWPKDRQGNYQEGEGVVLRHILSWTAAKDVFQLHGAQEKLIEKLSPEARDRIAVAISSFTAVTKQLIEGNIKINLLKLILSRRDAFSELLKIDCLVEHELCRDKVKVQLLLQNRDAEMKAVYHEKELVNILLTMTHKLEEHITVDITALEESHRVSVETQTLDYFMEVNLFDRPRSPKTGVVTYFDLDNDIRNMAEVLHTFWDSYLFQVCWEEQVKKLAWHRDPMEPQVAEMYASPAMIHDDIFQPCHAKYMQIYDSVRNGTIKLGVVDKLFKAYVGKYKELAQDLLIMCRLDYSNDQKWIQRRAQQIQQYHELHLAVASAQTIMMVKETLCLQGDFRVLQTLLGVTHADFHEEPLSRIDNDLMQAKIVLVDIDDLRRHCLKELGLRRHFVSWVKEALEDINELKVFVDLATISAGENDLDVDRVACFHDAVLGYSSMLYDLKPDSGFHTFKQVLDKLWRALENDSNLPKKLRDTARHLEWLKTVKDSHGSVELSSLSLASSINNKGIYVICAHNSKKLSLDTALKLQILEEHDEGQEMRYYTLEDLRELQNKLMLMSGKGDQGNNEVDHFAEVFANVQRLTEAFIALHIAGNPLFRNWEAQINCSLNNGENSIVIDFNLDNTESVIAVDGNIEEQLPELCRKMEKCLKYWMDFVDKQRAQHYYLNYYTAEQIVSLCSKLTQKKVANLEKHVLMMLSFIKPNCTATDLREVWHALQYEILNKGDNQDEDINFHTFVEVAGKLTGVPDMAQGSDHLPRASVVERRNAFRKFDFLWNGYMKDMKNVLPDILDIKTLGRLLELLANKETEIEEDISEEEGKQFITRELPKGLTPGNPNLIVCTHEEVLTSCISIYMSNEQEVLPTYDEVLLCNSSTSYEQVELFLRRCLTVGYRGRKIYTLLYGDLLTYDVSSKVESFFQHMKMQSRKDYRLVVICSSEREHAYLPSAFSQYRLHIIPQEPFPRIQSYLRRQYSVPAGQCSAAAVFRDRLCVGVVSSERAGVGKSLYVQRLHEELMQSSTNTSTTKCIRLIEPKVDENIILQSLLSSETHKYLTIFHFDVTSSVQKGLHDFLFKLLILRYLMDSEGKMWKCSNEQLYIIEILKSTLKLPRNASRKSQTGNTSFIDVFPNIFCQAPKEVLMVEMRMLETGTTENFEDPLMDDEEFMSEAFQRPYQYLTRFHNHRECLDTFKYHGVEGSHVECLQMLLMYCGIMDPSWAELRNFTWFLNLQLRDCETSVFCDITFTEDTLKGFKSFVVDFMILMAKDFATPSLSISDQSSERPQMDLGVSEEDLAPFLIRKRWESNPHPYIFFNSDHVSMTFIGFHLEPNSQNFVDAVDPFSRKVIRRNIMTMELYEGLRLQRVPFNIDFDRLPRGEKIERICRVLGIQWPLDPDETYELTMDNILKMLAIHMRFRCGIPVIVMGETGCGKTRLIKFLCELHRSGVATENMKLVKVHGGTSSDVIYTKVREAEAFALTNKLDYGFDSVLFFDEANTTEAISSIKEILCDQTVKGERLAPNSGLQIIAACNPYRKHTDEMIQRLESAGLGYRVCAEETDEKLGSIPLRQLVYRVQALPPSMIPLVWDFGQLNDRTETMYIQQIVQRVVGINAIDMEYINMITDVLSASQTYMRTRNDECSFVSLRDVERCMQAFVWFYENHLMLFDELQEFEKNQNALKTERPLRFHDDRHPVFWSLVMAVGVCYHGCLENKEEYRRKICRKLPLEYSPMKVMQEISLMQDLLLSGVPLGETIARNSALKENVFMMVLCIELRIPLFLVGKPGSSKSLSKTLVADAMQGQAAHSELYRKLKQIHLVSFQCSPHSTPEGIINTFKQCGRFQEGKNLDEYISVVVLDEIGLAEDSPKMPLKTLHPLLEEGCIDDEPLPHKKVGFIGISNWALDPAKMNRGIFVSRGDPDEKELIESAKGICSSDAMILEKVREFFQPFARAYLNICRKQGKGFFGLRDYYSLVKMIFAMAKATQQKPSEENIVEAVLRNFSGKDDVDAVSVFTKRLQLTPNLESSNVTDLVRQNILAIGQEEECRYLLVLTKNYAALQILQQTFFSETGQPEIIFGSSFPKDQEYTQICRNINRVKICMETGQTVMLLNLQNLYESLYDALNQYYVYLGGQKYVDLGLGTHRVKCRVHKDFRLIVIEEKEVVYKQFPIPLINRLEKHYLDIHTVLKNDQKITVKKLERWVKQFVSPSSQHEMVPQTYKYQPPDVFIGYHSDTCASVVLQVIEQQRQEMETSDPEVRILEESKLILLNCATPDSVVRLDCTALPKVESDYLSKVYFEEQRNSCLADFILAQTDQDVQWQASFTEMTTFSRLLTASDLEPLEQLFHRVELLSLQQFDTEQSFLKKIRHFLTTGLGSHTVSRSKILIIQSDFDEASQSANLIASAKYSSINEINKIRQENIGSNVFVFFITKLPRMEGGTSYVGFHGGPWRSVHIDDLRKSKDIVSDIKALRNMTISQLFEEKITQTEAMELDDMYTEETQDDMEFENQDSWDAVVDTTALVRSCVQSAVGMLRDQVESGYRSTRRVELLLTLLSNSEGIQGKFLRTVKRRLHSLLLTHDGNTFSSLKSNWVIKEASNIDALQEGGTFRHTLWKRVQAVVIPFLAQLVSVIDRDQNLDLLLDANSGELVKNLWLEIFDNDKLLDVPYLTFDLNSETRTILVQNYIALDKKLSCNMPFSWRIKDYLEELWVHALQHEGHTQSQFDEFFWKTPLGRHMAAVDPETQSEFFRRYLQDFVCMTMNVTSQEDLQLLSSALNCCVNELQSQHNSLDKEQASLPWIHAAYHEFKNRLQNLSRMITIQPQVTQVLLKNLHAQDGVELVLDVYAAFACVEFLEPEGLESDAQMREWLRQVKKLQVPVELICSENSVRHYGDRSKTMVCRVQSGWNRIFVLSLFVEHMLLGIEAVEKNLKPLVLEHMRRLGQILENNSDLRTQQSFEAVIGILKSCRDAVGECIFRFGLQPCPVCMGDVQDPLCLPCGHLYCVACIKQWLGLGQMFCPLCMGPVPDNFPLVPSEELRALIKRHAGFRKQVNAFFIDLVSTVCFKDSVPPCEAIILHLLSFLMVEAKTATLLRGNRQILTKVLSPFEDSVDKNPVVRSVVLKLLLKYSFDEAKGYLQQHLTEVEQSNLLEESDKTELYSLYVNCLEDSMFERTQFSSAGLQQACLQVEKDFLVDLMQSGAASASTATVEYLQQVARLRMDLDMAATLLVQQMEAPAGAPAGNQNGTTAFLDGVVDLCRRSGNDWFRVYLIRKICSQHGVEFVQKLLKEDGTRWLFPEEVLQQSQQGSPIDQFLVCGEDYKTIRDAVAAAMIDGKVGGLGETCEGCKCLPQRKATYLLLALFREVTSLYRETNASFHPKPEQCQALVAYIEASSILGSNQLKAFAKGLVANKLGPNFRSPTSGFSYALEELTVHLFAILLCGNHSILAPLQQLALTPAQMQRAFLPTMPEDMLSVARETLGPLHWYLCPNGHPCAIGECGQPMEKSHCLDCGVEIGGGSHIPLPGFNVLAPVGDRTQTGHILGDPGRRDQPDMQDTKDMSPVAFSLVRMLSHMALLMGSGIDTQSIATMIKPAVPDPAAFLLEHLFRDLAHVSRSLGRGMDDTVGTIHLLISSLLERPQTPIWPTPYDPVLSTKEARNGWDKTLCNTFIIPQLKNMDWQLKEANSLVRADSRVSLDPVVRVVFGEPRLFLASLPQGSLVHGSAVWSCREKVSVGSLAHMVDQNHGRESLPVLWRFLQKEAELRLVKFLPDVLALQKELVKKFQNVTELSYKTMGDFINAQKAVSLKAWYEKCIKIFLTTWNQLRVSLATNGEIKIPAEFCREDLDLSADFRVLLPQRQGPGLCATALVSYLIALHNELIYCLDKHTGETTSYKVSPADLTDLHVIRYDLEKDLVPMVLSNTQYSVERGQEALLQYDLVQIQQQVLGHLLQGKPLITLQGIPTLINRHDRNYEIILKEVKEKVKQEPLQTLTLSALQGELQSYSDVCEALSRVEVALGFLAMTGDDPHMQLASYLEEVLQMGDQTAPHILKTLSMCNLKHCVALWQLLTSLKSENMLHLKRDPFSGISREYKQPLGEEERRLLSGFFSKSGADHFLLEMHEFLLLVLKHPNATDTYRPNWGLKDTMVSYMERKDLDVPPDVEESFPPQILLSHFTEAWRLSLAFRHQRTHRQ